MPTQNYYMFFDFKSAMFTMEGNIFVVFSVQERKKGSALAI